MTARLQNRRDTSANWTSNNPTLAAGELGLETDTTRWKMGNGSTAWNSLGYSYVAVAAGGATNALLAKNSSTDYDTKWVTTIDGGTP